MISQSIRRILLVFGTRPEAIKMAPVFTALNSVAEFDVKICVTGQHRQMLDQVLSLFGIVPDFDLDMMRPNQDLTDITVNVLHGLRDIFKEWKPDLLLVHGDTTTAMASSIAAFYSKIPLAHVEAGLRTSNIYSPWPEEMNRRIIGRIASLHFAPTESARKNLLAEGYLNETIHVTGNTVIDALSSVVDRINANNSLKQQLQQQFSYLSNDKRMILVTGHRRENFGQGFENICNALLKISRCKGVEIVYPVHLNPNVQEPVRRILDGCENIHLIEPLEYLPFVYLMNRSDILLTDSGGVQEEAPFLGKPVLVMRDTTERPEAVQAGTAKLVGTDPSMIVAEVTLLLDDECAYRRMACATNPYGDGYAAEYISKIIRGESN